MGYRCPCPTIHVNTAAVHNSSAVSLFLLLVVRGDVRPGLLCKEKKEALFRMVSRKGQKGDPFC